LSALTLEFFATVSIAVVAVLIGFRLLWGELEFFNGFFILLIAPEFYIPLRKMGSAYHARMEAIGSVDKILEIYNEDIPKLSSGKNIKPDLSEVRIKISNLNFSYKNRDNVLSNFNLEVKEEEKLLIKGRSGVGKSTIFSLLLKFAPIKEGKILINGIPLKDIDTEYWRNNVAWVGQNSRLVSGTILDNLHLGNDLNELQIKDICQKLKIHDFIKSLPEGYNTVVGENGYGLSGGEIQRLAIARAFMRDSALLLLDEPTASLDFETEKFLYRAIDKLSKGKTVITIAHRLSSIDYADRVINLEGDNRS